MSGRATFTIVMSSRSMNTPVQTAASVHHLRAASGRAAVIDGELAISMLCMSSVLRRSHPNDVGGRADVTPAVQRRVTGM
jgi:hypothetical protein